MDKYRRAALRICAALVRGASGKPTWMGWAFAASVLGWDRKTIRKGQQELDSGEPMVDGRLRSGRKRAEEHFPQLLEDISAIVEPIGQADPTFRSTRLHSAITAVEVRARIIRDMGYCEQALIAERSLCNKLKELGYPPQRVKKCEPIKRIPETDAIFEEVHRINAQADRDPGVPRISLDTETVVKIGAFSRGGRSRCPHAAWDHDFESESTLRPFGILLPERAESFLRLSASKVTADFMVDCIEEMWSRLDPAERPHTLVINADNGPENNGRRRQWLYRLAAFSKAQGITIQLAYYPPYHSKYNPVERLWGVLKDHERGELLSCEEKAFRLARSMTYKGKRPRVRKITKVYKAAVSLTKKAMCAIERCLQRKQGLEPWFIRISPNLNLGQSIFPEPLLGDHRVKWFSTTDGKFGSTPFFQRCTSMCL